MVVLVGGIETIVLACYKLITSLLKGNTNNTTTKLLLNEVSANLYMLGSIMLNRIMNYIDCRHVITVKSHGDCLLNF